MPKNTVKLHFSHFFFLYTMALAKWPSDFYMSDDLAFWGFVLVFFLFFGSQETDNISEHIFSPAL